MGHIDELGKWAKSILFPNSFSYGVFANIGSGAVPGRFRGGFRGAGSGRFREGSGAGSEPRSEHGFREGSGSFRGRFRTTGFGAGFRGPGRFQNGSGQVSKL